MRLNIKFIEFFDIAESEVPTFRMTASVEDMIKYKPEDSSLSEENIGAFVKSFRAGDVKPHLKSEELPEDWDAAPVKMLVSSNFAEVALDSSKDVMMLPRKYVASAQKRRGSDTPNQTSRAWPRVLFCILSR